MFAAHLAAGLAIKGRVPRAPVTALLIGAFIPDLVWIALASAGVEPTAKAVFFDDWSHSLASTLLWAVLFAAFFRRFGWSVVAAIWCAVASHFLLDLPVHPKALALYPHSAVHLSVGLEQTARMNYWLIQLAAIMALLGAYVYWARRHSFAMKPVFASCAYVLAFHTLGLPSS
jgi:membrane-bound metal-dependent hydrolase YbcI (DUF457 family)